MDLNIIGGKDNKFTEAVTLSFLGCDVANFELPFHKVLQQALHVAIKVFKSSDY